MYIYTKMCSWIPYNKNLMSVVCTNFYGFQWFQFYGLSGEVRLTFIVSYFNPHGLNLCKLDIDFKSGSKIYFWNIWSLINRDSRKTINFIDTGMKNMN